MIVFAALTPHSPLLLPTIGAAHAAKTESVRAALDRLSEELYASAPDTILVLSGHGSRDPKAFSINLHDHYRADLSEFGDLTTATEFAPDLALIDGIQRGTRRAQIPFTLFSDPALDYGTSVPLLLLAGRLPDTQIVPVSYSNLDAKAHFEFGRALREVLERTNRRVAVIASGDLSHALRSDSPAGYRKEGTAFDAAVRDVVHSCAASKLLSMKTRDVKAAAECGYRPLVTLLGILDGVCLSSEELAYDDPFGVGYLIAQFHFA